MITGVKITGFQSHTNSYFNLGPGLNVITGPSDSGKTAIIRAVKWVAFNEPAGEAFLNQSVGEAKVEIELANGITIIKRRKSKKTTYTLSTIPEPFEKSEVPYEVKQALGIVKQTFGDFETALNFAFQLEAPFLISETASAGAKILGKLAGTEAVDLAIKDVSKDTYAARQEKTAAEKEIEKIDAQLGEFINLEDLKEQLEVCEMMAQQLEADAVKVGKLQQLKTSYGTIIGLLETYQEKLKRLAIVDDLDEQLKHIEADQLKYEKLRVAYMLYKRSLDDLNAANDQLDLLQGVELLADQLQQVKNSSQRLTLLRDLQAKNAGHSFTKTSAEMTLNGLQGLPEAEGLLEGIRKATERQQTLKALNDQYGALCQITKSRGEILRSFENLPEADTLIQGLEADRNKLQQLKALRTVHRLSVQDVEQTVENVRDADLYLEEARTALAQSWEATGGICPLCESPIERGHNH